MKNPKKVIMVLVLAGLFLLPPAAVAVSDEHGAVAGAQEASQAAYASSAAYQMAGGYTGLLAGRADGKLDLPPVIGKEPGISHVLGSKYGPSPASRGPRAAPDVYVASPGVRLVPPTSTDMWYGAGVVALKGADTQFNVTVNNSGDGDANPCTVTFVVRDLFDKEMSRQVQTQNMPAGTNYTFYFQFRPTYCSYLTVNITTQAAGDSNTNNDQVEFNQVFVGRDTTGAPVYAFMVTALWADVSASTAGWNGDIGPNNKWHITSNIDSDNATQHSAPEAWYEGRDLTSKYDPNLDISARTPSLDLRNFGKTWFLHFDYLFHGAFPALDAGDYFENAFSLDNGVTWDSARTHLDGPMIAAAGLQTQQAFKNDWLIWVTQMQGGTATGLEISEYAGSVVQIRNRFVSNALDQDTGIYLDDFCIWGVEIQYDVGIKMSNDISQTHVNEKQTIGAKVTNYRQTQPRTFNCTLNVTKRDSTTSILTTKKTVNALATGASQDISFDWTPSERGDYYVIVNVSDMKDEDGYNDDDFREVHVSGAPTVLVVDDNPFASPENTTDILINTLVTVPGYDDYATFYPKYGSSRIGNDWGGDGPSLDMMKKFDVVIWCTGWDSRNATVNGTLTANDQANLKSYLAAGGSLWLEGFNLVNDLNTNKFVTDTLHITAVQNNTQLKNSQNIDKHILPTPVNGTPGSLADGKVYTTSPVIGTNWSYDQTDLVQPDASAQGVFFGNATGAAGNPWFVAIQYSGAYRLVFQTFDFGWMPYDDERKDYTQRVLGFLLGGLSSDVVGQTGSSIMTKMVDPGGTAVFTIFINNSGTKARTINNIDVGDVPLCWTAVVDPAVKDGAPATTINPGESQEITLTVTAPEKALAGDQADLGINVSFKGYSPVLFNRTITKVRAILKVDIAASNTVQNLTGSGAASYPFTLRNSGNIQVVADLQKSGDRIEFFYLSLSSVLLQPFEEKSLTALMQVPEGAFRNAGNYTLVTTLTSRVSIPGAYYNSSLNFTTNVRVVQVFSAKIDDVEISPSDGLVDMSVAKPSAKVTVTVSSAKGNGYDNVSIELRPKSFAPTGSPSKSWDGTGWSLPKTVVDTTPFMSLGKQSPLTVFVPVKADAGEYTIEVRITPGSGKLSDGDSTTVVLKVAKPDVAFSGTISFNPKEAEVGTQVRIKVIVKNIGGAKANNIDVAFYSGGDNLIQTEKISELAATTGSAPVEITWDAFVEGENQITVKLDPDSKLSETTRDNNEISDTLIGLRSDLQFDGAPLFKIAGAVKTSVKAGDTVQIEVTVSNVGLHGVNLTGVTVQLTDSATNEVFTETIGSLLSRSSAKVTFTWVAKKAGTHTMTIKVNPDGAIKEKDLTNNEVSGTIKVAPPPGEEPRIPWTIIGAVVGVVVLVAVLALVMMRRKSPGAPASAPVSAPPEETVAVVAEEAPAAPGEPAK